MYQRARLKEEVKQAMRSTRPRPMWVALLFSVIVAAGSWLVNTVIGAVSGVSALSSTFAALLSSGYELEEAFEQLIWAYSAQLPSVVSAVVLGSLLTGLISYLWTGLMRTGFEGYCLSMVRGEQPRVNRLFCGFPLIGKVLLTQLLVWVFTQLWSLLYAAGFAAIAVIAGLLMEKLPAVGAVLLALGCAAFMILEVRLVLRYALADYALLDQGKYGLEAVTESKRLMKGNKGRLFMLQLSFIGWYLIQADIVWVGIIVIVAIVMVGGGSYMFAAGSISYGALAGMLGGILAVCAVMAAACVLFSSWLQPYVTGAVGRFYEFLRGWQTPAEGGWPTLDSGSGSCTRTEGSSGGPSYPQY